MTHKHILVADRVRQPPTSGFSWIDPRFLREFAARLSHDAVVLYLFLAAVSDKHGLSYWRDATVAMRLRISEQAVVAARDELLTADLVAYQTPDSSAVAAGGRACGARRPRRVARLARPERDSFATSG